MAKSYAEWKLCWEEKRVVREVVRGEGVGLRGDRRLYKQRNKQEQSKACKRAEGCAEEGAQDEESGRSSRDEGDERSAKCDDRHP